MDQMGAAYGVDPRAGRIVWKAVPDGEAALGSNTSSPCVVGDRLYYGTMTGNLHILNLQDGKVVKTVRVGMPVVGAVTAANDSIYFQALDAVARCMNLDGTPRWTWDHYARYTEPEEVAKAEASKPGHPGGWTRPHYGGGDVAVSGKRVVTSTVAEESLRTGVHRQDGHYP